MLQDYDFLTANNAVTQYAKHDMREYATFPTVGVIVDAIRKEEGVKNRIFNSLFRGCTYPELQERAKEIITEKQYLALCADQETLRQRRDEIMRQINSIYRGEAQLENNDQRDSTEHEQIQRQGELLGIPQRETAVDGHGEFTGEMSAQPDRRVV